MSNAFPWVQRRNARTAEMIAFILSCGYRVFVRKSTSLVDSEWCYYTDGTRIAYAQWSDYRMSVSTVHVPSRESGTGFVFADRIDADTLRDAIACHVPSWAWPSQRNAVRKWKDWDAFCNSSAFNRELFEVQP